MSEQNPKIEAAEQQVVAVQTRNLNAELQALAKFGGFNVLVLAVSFIAYNERNITWISLDRIVQINLDAQLFQLVFVFIGTVLA